MSHLRQILLAVASVGLLCGSAWADEPQAEQPAAAQAQADQSNIVVDENGVAAQGYDLVSYIQDGQATPGSAEFAVEHEGATYLFASAEHRDAFAANPAGFLPAFGGWCAFGVANGSKFQPNPETFAVQDGRLLLFFNGTHEGQTMNTQTMWNENAEGMLQQADANWPTIAAPSE